MAKRKVWIGSVGPFLYDDESEKEEIKYGIYTEGRIRADTPPEEVEEVARLFEIEEVGRDAEEQAERLAMLIGSL